MKVQKVHFKKLLSVLVVLAMVMSSLTGCGISSKHLEVSYEENKNSSISDWNSVDSNNNTTWDNATVVSWSDVDEFSDWVYSEILFDEITDEMPIVECKILDYRSNGQYFDGEKVYSMVGDRFDVNSFVAKYAVGTGVIVICVVLTVVTAGGTTPICCFIAGAADASVSMAIKGAAFGAATKAITTAIKSGGNLEESLYGALEGSADGYMWGAIYGAATGGFKSKYCFDGSTLVSTPNGYEMISTLEVGDLVFSYDEQTGAFDYKPITQILTNEVDEMVFVTVDGETIETTAGHPFYTDTGWICAADLHEGSRLMASDSTYKTVSDVSIISAEATKVFNLCVQDYSTYVVGESNVVVHNRCKINEEYAGKNYQISDPELAKKYPNGVNFTKDGYPDFSPYIKDGKYTVTFEKPSASALKADTCLNANYNHDFKMANDYFGFKETPAGYTWNHKEDMMTLELIPTDLHQAVRHSGGAALIRELLAVIP